MSTARILIAAALVLVVDRSTKSLAEAALRPGEPVPLAGDLFRLTLGYNTGVAFGIGAAQGVPGGWALVVTGAIIAAFLVWLAVSHATGTLPRRPLLGWTLGLILGGAVANFVDRWPDGRVTDFLDAGLGDLRWPTFNLADGAIVVAVAIVTIASLLERDPAAARHEPEPHER